MVNKMKIHKIISLISSKEDFYSKAQQLGELTATMFTGGSGKSQIKNLQNIANSTLKITDILNYIKHQASKGKKEDNIWRKNNLDQNIIESISWARSKEKEIKIEIPELSQYEEQQAELQLCREFIKHIVVHYEYYIQ